MRYRSSLVVLGLLLAACSVPELACTEIGSSSGIGVTVSKRSAADLSKLTLRVCWQGTCRNKGVELAPGSTSVEEGCEGKGPDAVCSATVVPNGTLVGFADLADLPEGKVVVEPVAVVRGATKRFGIIDVTATKTFPNGPTCPAGGNQAHITLS